MSVEVAWPAEPFWDYSLELYGRPGVAAACLALQERHGLDVNLLLLCCWAGARGIELDERRLGRLQAAVAGWQDEVVRPLRALRRGLKARLAESLPDSVPAGWPDLVRSFRTRVQDLELDAEHLEQLQLGRFTAYAPTGAAAGVELALANLLRYQRFAPKDREPLGAILEAAFPDAERSAVEATLSRSGGAAATGR